tara:strand:- start:8652 stop:10535 length:1884 start_codon:yes stop_codon:yes gene_type:complete
MSKSLEIKNFIQKQNSLDTLRFITCGSVDDGKSTLLGRMLYQGKQLFEDQIDGLIKDSKKIGTQDGQIDFALLVDGLAAEREQGITIDVAYRFFTTEKRKFIVADSPGHEQYTRNMVTAASNADLAIILIDARNGIMSQTKRHSFLADLMGIKNIIVAVNKMDLINFSEKKYMKIVKDYTENVLPKLHFENVTYIPISALKGDNITVNSKNMDWFNNDPLMKLLESIDINNDLKEPFSMPIQNAIRPNLDFRGFSGTVSSGVIKEKDEITVSGSYEKANVKQIFFGEKKLKSCTKGDAVTITFDREIDISRGDIIFNNDLLSEKYSAFVANLVWLGVKPCFSNRSFILKTANRQLGCELIKIKNKINVNTFDKVAAGSLEMNDIAECEIHIDNDLPLMPYSLNKTLGNFIFIDKETNLTVAAGVIKHNLRRSSNVKWQETEITKDIREDILGQKSYVLWFTGLSGSGKSTIANLLEKKLSSQGKLTYLLDGDNLRHGLNKDLGFKKEHRIENLRRVGEVAKILNNSGVIVLASFISPYRKDRENIREKFSDGEFIEIYIDAKLDTLKSRDPKGLYAKALKGKIPNFTGISSEYEAPEEPEIIIDSEKISPEEAVSKIMDYLKEKDGN